MPRLFLEDFPGQDRRFVTGCETFYRILYFGLDIHSFYELMKTGMKRFIRILYFEFWFSCRIFQAGPVMEWHSEEVRWRIFTGMSDFFLYGKRVL